MNIALGDESEFLHRAQVSKRICMYVQENFPTYPIDDFHLEQCVDDIMAGDTVVSTDRLTEAYDRIDEYFTVSIQEIRAVIQTLFSPSSIKRRKKT